ncbi:hypothetical protein FOZ63_006914, partial [Perkinsus olseni]
TKFASKADGAAFASFFSRYPEATILTMTRAAATRVNDIGNVAVGNFSKDFAMAQNVYAEEIPLVLNDVQYMLVTKHNKTVDHVNGMVCRIIDCKGRNLL